MKKNILAISIFLLGWAAPLPAEIITYQGRLKEASLPVNDNRLFLFEFCDDESAGACTASPSGAQPFAVQNGLFKSTFTAPAVNLTSGQWYLKVSVAGTPLTPRERLTAVPYAVYASSSAYSSMSVQKTGDTMSGQLTLDGSTLTVTGNEFSVGGSTLTVKYGNVGVGTQNPLGALHVDRAVNAPLLVGGPTVSYTAADAAIQDSGSLLLRSALLAGIGSEADIVAVGKVTGCFNSTLSLWTRPDGCAGVSPVRRMIVNEFGNVGISTFTPQARLDVLAAGASPDAIAQIWRDSSGVVVSSVSATGMVMGVKFIGDGSGLINVAATTGVDATKVAKAGDTMTGQLTLDASTLTVTGNAFSVSGSTLVVADGKVGIGAEVPQAKLHISSGGMIIDGDVAGVMLHVKAPPSGTTTRISLEGSDSNSFQAYELKQPSRTWWIAQNLGNFSDGRLQIFDASASNYRAVFFATGDIGLGGTDAQTAPVLMVKPSGLVGIGANSPGAALDVRAPGTIDMAQIWRDPAGTVVSSVSVSGVMRAIQFVGDGSGLTNVAAATGVDASKVAKAGDTMTGQLTLAASTLTVTGNAFSVGGSTLVVDGGNVGIGVASPWSRLTIAGGVGNEIEIPSAGTNVQILGTGSPAQFQIGGGTSFEALIGATPRLVIDGAGNTSVSTLAASGSITAARYQINGANVLALLPGIDSLGVGKFAGLVNTGDSNVFLGYAAGYYNTTAAQNTFIGYEAGYSNVSGGNNSFLGYKAGASNLTGGNNSLVGYQTAYFNQTGSANAIFGNDAGGFGSAASNSFSSSTIVGYRGGYNLTTGSDNTFLGWQSGYNVTTGNGNIIIGYGQNAQAAGANSSLNIGGVLFGDLAAGTIGISTGNPQAALDMVSTATDPNVYAQLWRNSAGVIVGSMSSTGNMTAVRYAGDGSGLTNVAATTGVDASKVAKAGDTMTGQLTLAGSSLTMHTAGVVNFTADAAGHVGINGYPDAASGLHISGTGSYEAGIRLNNGGTVWSMSNTGGPLSFIKVDGSTYTPFTFSQTGVLTAVSSPAGNSEVHADRFYGSGANLTGVLDSTKLPLSGGTMSGGLIIGDVSGTAFRVGGSTLTVTNGRVGINTASPAEALDIGSGNLRLMAGGMLEWGSAALSILASAPGMAFYEGGQVRLNISSFGGYTSVGAGDILGVNIDTTSALHVAAKASPGADGRVAVFGDLRSNGSVSGQYLASGNFETTIEGADSADLAAGLRAVIRHENAGVGVVKKAYGLIVDDLQNSGGTIDTTYGVYIGTQTAGAQVNPPYSLYAADQAAWNYFGGRVGIGTESPQDMLHMIGANPWIQIRDTGGTKGASIGMDVNKLRFDESGMGNRMVLDLNTSRVGINTLGPNYTLDVQGGYVNASGGLCINDNCVSDWGSAGVWSRNGLVVSPSNASNNVLIQSTLTVAGNAFSVGGSTLVVDAGRVGIGVPNPTVALDVSGGINATTIYAGNSVSAASIVKVNGGGMVALESVAGNSNISATAAGAKNMTFTTDSVERMRIDSNGRVGVGTALPAYALHVSSGDASGWRPDVMIESTASGTPQLLLQSGGHQGRIATSGSNGGTYIGSMTNDFVSLHTNGVEVIRLATDKKVGIGATSPGALLEIRDNAAANSYMLLIGTGASGSFVSISSMGVVGIGYGNPSTSTVLHAQAVATNLTAGEDVAAGLIGSARAIGTGPEDVAVGGDFRAEADGNQNLAFLAGLHANVERTSAGTGVIANAVGLYIDMPRNGSSPGGFTDTYGIYIATQTSGNQTNLPYAVYSEDQNARAYFAGKMGLGTASPRYALEISSAAGSSDQMLVVSTGTDMVFGVKGNGEVYGAKFIGDGSGLVNVVMNGGTMSQPLVINADTAVYPSNLVTAGLVISTSGALQTAGMGNGGIVGNPRGIGAVDLQTSRLAATEVASAAYSVVGGGKGNKATIAFAVASGGNNNIASGGYSVVGGGASNTSSNGWTTVGGGSSNVASQNNATVGGGSANIASGYSATVGGGSSNLVSGNISAVGGGSNNSVSGIISAVGGGEYNVVSGSDSAVAGGSYNTVVGTSAVVAGGYNNKAGGVYSFIGGGSGNTALDYSLVAGGASNNAMGYYTAIGGGRGNYGAYFATIGGGSNNRVEGYFAVVSGGENNLSTAPYSVVGGGLFNTSSGTYSGVLAGHMNEALGTAAAIGGGRSNRATGENSFVGGGSGNIAFDLGTTVAGGVTNTANEAYSFVGGGNQNNAATGYTAIAGGYQNTIGTVGGDGAYSFIGAGYSNETQTDYTVIGGGIDNYITNAGMYSVIGGGGGNTVSAQYAAVVGGLNNSAKGQYSFVGGGGPNATITGNEAAGDFSAVVGGSSNTVTAQLGFVGGGDDNHVYGDRGVAVGGARNTAGVTGTKFHAAVVGGQDNRAIGEGSFVGGGAANTAFGNYSVVPGGHSNWAGGSNSFAAGYTSTAAADGSFAWNDASVDSLVNTYTNQVQFRATGGFWVSTGTIHATPGLFVSMANWVGMGTDAPAKMLHIKNQNVVPDIRLERGFGGNYWDIGGLSGTYFNIAYGGTMHISVSDSGGQVGIGVSPTTSRLQINGDLGLGDGTAVGNAPIVIRLTAAAAVQDGDVVVASGGNQFSTTLTGNDYRAIGVAVGATAGGSVGKVAVGGVALVNCAAGPTAGQHAVASATAGQAAGTITPAAGSSIGQFLTSCGTPSAGKAYLLLN
ncbi:MAG: hypothetical protein A2X31_08050 [Elusimicrobia bacterium GWB2_63_22]|nr:MAG: hypothetical protein A2X31_08050 [Elusimicrobia bacterium GWB2_63_22]